MEKNKKKLERKRILFGVILGFLLLIFPFGCLYLYSIYNKYLALSPIEESIRECDNIYIQFYEEPFGKERTPVLLTDNAEKVTKHFRIEGKLEIDRAVGCATQPWKIILRKGSKNVCYIWFGYGYLKLSGEAVTEGTEASLLTAHVDIKFIEGLIKHGMPPPTIYSESFWKMYGDDPEKILEKGAKVPIYKCPFTKEYENVLNKYFRKVKIDGEEPPIWIRK